MKSITGLIVNPVAGMGMSAILRREMLRQAQHE
jgi:predicted polyphosphate/ATP-dependent NAD kinase